jgi:SAM-dependent methyltransferase
LRGTISPRVPELTPMHLRDPDHPDALDPLRTLRDQYPWLARTIDPDEYLPPDYYTHLLKDYRFGGIPDLDLLAAFLATHTPHPATRILELGCGNGRATARLGSWLARSPITLVDLSGSMLAATRHAHPAAHTVQADLCDFLLAPSAGPYDVVYSLWALSHSIHRHLSHEQRSPDQAGAARAALRRLFGDVLAKRGTFFIIHFDSRSQEQAILMPHWATLDPLFADTASQSPSFLLLLSVLEDLASTGALTYTVRHHVGDPIEYSTLDEALETFCNFHLEGRLMTLPPERLAWALGELRAALAALRDPSGRVVIRPGCFVFTGARLR